MAKRRSYGPFGNAAVQCEHGHDVCPQCDGPWFKQEAKERGMTVEAFTAECIARAAHGFSRVQAWLDGRTT